MPEKLILKYTVTLKDATQGFCALLWYGFHWRFLVPCLIVDFLCGVLLLASSSDLTSVAIILMVIPICFVFSFLLGLLMLRQKILKNERAKSETIWEIGDDKILVKSKLAESSLDWAVFKEVRETKKLYLLKIATFVYIPKRAFESSEQETAFRNIVKSHVAKARFKAK